MLPPPLFVLVLDTCIIEEEIEQLKDSLLQVSAAFSLQISLKHISLPPPLLSPGLLQFSFKSKERSGG